MFKQTHRFAEVIVTGVTVYADLAVAVVVGVIISALAYAWNAASRISTLQRRASRRQLRPSP